MVGTLVHQLTRDASIQDIENAGLGAYYTDHGVGVEFIQKEFNKFELKIIIFKIIM